MATKPSLGNGQLAQEQTVAAQQGKTRGQRKEEGKVRGEAICRRIRRNKSAAQILICCLIWLQSGIRQPAWGYQEPTEVYGARTGYHPRPPHSCQDPSRRRTRPTTCRSTSLEQPQKGPKEDPANQRSNRTSDQDLCRMEAQHEGSTPRGRTAASRNSGEVDYGTSEARTRPSEAQHRRDPGPRDALGHGIALRQRQGRSPAADHQEAVPRHDYAMQPTGTAEQSAPDANGSDDSSHEYCLAIRITNQCVTNTSGDKIQDAEYAAVSRRNSPSGRGQSDAREQEAEDGHREDRNTARSWTGRSCIRGASGDCGGQWQSERFGFLATIAWLNLGAIFQGCIEMPSFSTISVFFWVDHLKNPDVPNGHGGSDVQYSEFPQILFARCCALKHFPSRVLNMLIHISSLCGNAKGLSELCVLIIAAFVSLILCLHRPILLYFFCVAKGQLRKVKRARHSVWTGSAPLHRVILRHYCRCLGKQFDHSTPLPTTRSRRRNKRRMPWSVCAVTAMILHLQLVLAQPGHPEEREEPHRRPPPQDPYDDLYREIAIHRLHRTELTVRAPISTSPDNMRSVIGDLLRLHGSRAVWNNFQVHQMQYPPAIYDRPLMQHVILESPGDRSWQHSLILHELIDGNNGGRPHREVLRIPAYITHEEYLDHIGFSDECLYSTCRVRIDGQLWPPDDPHPKLIKIASLVSTFIKDERDMSCSESRNTRSSSRTPSTTTDRSDESMLMQTTQLDSQLTRAAEDPIYRIISSRARHFYNQLGGHFGLTISVWPITRQQTWLHTDELRVWLDHSQSSWTTQCQHNLRVHLLRDRDVSNQPFEDFYLTAPLPTMRRLTGNNINILAVQHSRHDTCYILADFWIQGHPLRAAFGIPTGTRVAQLIARTPFTSPTTRYQLIWTIATETTIFNMHDTIVLPNGAFVDISPDECTLAQGEPSTAADHTSLLQMSSTIPHGVSSNHRALVFSPYGHIMRTGSDRATLTEGEFWAPILRSTPKPCFDQSCKRQHNRSHLNPHRSPYYGLQPPGNPEDNVHWLSTQWGSMDYILHRNNETYILDFVNKPEPRQSIRLFEALGLPNRPVPTPSRATSPAPTVILLEETLPGNCTQKQAKQASLQTHDQEAIEYFDISEEPRTCYEEKSTLDLGIENEDFLHFLDFNPLTEELQIKLPDNIELHSATVDWLRVHPLPESFAWDPGEVLSINIHTDGSFRKNTSAWAFVITVQTTDNILKVLGFAGGKVAVEQEHQRWIGSIRHSAATAETEALFWATWWTLRMTHSTGWTGPITFKWDSTCAGAKAQGHANAHHYLEQGHTGERLRSLQQALTTAIGEHLVHHEHIRAYQGEPLNEFADSIAKLANLQDAELFHVDWPIQRLIQELPHGFTWLWLYLQAHPHLRHCRDLRQNQTGDYAEQLPVWDNGQLQWRFRPGQPKELTQQELQEITTTMTKSVEQQRPEVTVHYYIQCASYNVLSLGETLCRQDQYAPGRVQLLRQICQQQGVHVLGIQEGRSKAGHFVSDNYIRFCAGHAIDGTAGVELWFSKQLPIGTSTSNQLLFFDKGHFHTVKADPRLLIIDYTGPAFEATFISGHAPHNARSKKRKKDGGKPYTTLRNQHARTDFASLCWTPMHVSTTLPITPSEVVLEMLQMPTALYSDSLPTHTI